MKTLKLLALAVTLTCAGMAIADDTEKHEMKIVIEGQSTDDGASFHWVSDDPGVDMANMQVGETRSIVDENGKSVLITREAEGFSFNVDGETIVMPDMGAHMATMTMVGGSDMTADFDVEVIGDHHGMPMHVSSAMGSGVTIITDEALDAGTQEGIKAVLQSVGRGEEVTFIDGSGADGKVVIKKVEILQ